MKNKRMIYKLFFSYILMIIPMMWFSNAIANFAIANMQEQVDEKIQKNGLEIIQEIDERWIEYKNKAVKISIIEELQAEKILTNQYSVVSKGMKYLSNILMMDENLGDIVLCYNERIYTAEGYSRLPVWLKDLGCDDNYISLGEKCLADENISVLYLKTSHKGYLLLHYPIEVNNWGKVDSVNFCIRMDEIFILFESLVEQTDIGIRMNFQNQWQSEDIYLTGSEKGIEEVDYNKFDTLIKEKKRTIKTQNSQFWGMNLQIVYDAKEVYHQIRFVKQINSVYMSIFLLISIFISYKISTNHYHKIYQLKKSLNSVSVQGETVNKRKWENDFDIMQDMIRHISTEIDCMKDERNTAVEMIKQQMALILFNGGIREENSINDMLIQCGYELQEPYFTVACIVVDNGILPFSIEKMIKENLGCISSVNDRRAVIVLYELPNEDFTKKQRSMLARKIQQDIPGDDRVKIGFSQTYDSVLRIPEAYLEATGICETLLNIDDQIVGYMDEFICVQGENVRFKGGTLERFEDAVMRGDLLIAQNSLDILLDDINGNGFSAESKKYQRYCIIQSILLCLDSQRGGWDAGLIKEIKEIDIDKEDFEKQIKESLKYICIQNGKEQKVHFAKIIEYINSNYYRYDLSLENVAEYAGLSKTYMSRLFKEKTGCKYIEYLTGYRMEQAQKLLKDTDFTINEIAGMVGYSNLSVFRNNFKEYCGMNASEYRRQHRNGQ